MTLEVDDLMGIVTAGARTYLRRRGRARPATLSRLLVRAHRYLPPLSRTASHADDIATVRQKDDAATSGSKDGSDHGRR
jgi:hypothetical protein